MKRDNEKDTSYAIAEGMYSLFCPGMMMSRPGIENPLDSLPYPAILRKIALLSGDEF